MSGELAPCVAAHEGPAWQRRTSERRRSQVCVCTSATTGVVVRELDIHECTISVDVEGGGAGFGSVRPVLLDFFQRRPTTR